MVWWGWVLIGGLAALVVVLLVFLLRKRTQVVGFTQEESNELVKVSSEQARKELDVEREMYVKLATLVSTLKQRLSQVDTWYEETKGQIDEGRKEMYANLVSSDSDLIAELDKQLGGSAAEDD